MFSPLSSVNSDGAGRSGTYILIDMVLNKMAKGKAPLSGDLERDALLWQPGAALPEAWEDERVVPFLSCVKLFAASAVIPDSSFVPGVRGWTLGLAHRGRWGALQIRHKRPWSPRAAAAQSGLQVLPKPSLL